MTDEQEGCNIDFASMERDELEQLANNMHLSLHAYADEQEQLRQLIVGLGYGLDTFAGEVVEANRFGNRKGAMEEIAVHLTHFASIAYKTSGVDRKVVAEAIEFSNLADMFMNGPVADKEDH